MINNNSSDKNGGHYPNHHHHHHHNYQYQWWSTKSFAIMLLLLAIMATSIADCRLRKSRRYHRTSSSLTSINRKSRGVAIKFTCSGRPLGYYADPDFECRIFHICDNFGRRIPMHCPPHTMFNQMYRVCDWDYNVDCPSSKSWYHVNSNNHGNTNESTERAAAASVPAKTTIQLHSTSTTTPLILNNDH
nr:U-scoloptoxin(01)-Er1a-like [Dermatophagoides farinae]